MTVQEKLIRNKLGLLELASYLGNVSEACRVMGYSRDTFYRLQKAHDEGGMAALMEQNRRVPNRKNRVSEEVEQAVVELALEDPSLGQKRASNELREQGVFISAAGVRCVWLRHDLETFKKRLKALGSMWPRQERFLPMSSSGPWRRPRRRRLPGARSRPSTWAIWALRTPTTWVP